MKAKSFDVAIIGAGPAGLSAACTLACFGGLSVVVLDQGDNFEKRIKTISFGETDLLCGVGGAGTLSGGKLCGIPASLGLWKKTWYALPSFVSFLQDTPLPHETKKLLIPGNTRLSSKDSVTRNGLFSKDYPTALLLKNEMHTFMFQLYKRATQAGCVIEEQHEISEIQPSNDGSFLLLDKNNCKHLSARMIMCATGRSGSSSIAKMLRRTLAQVTPQAPDLGVRVNIPLSASDIFVNIGQDVKLKQHVGDIDMRTFCVCIGGDSTLIKSNGISYVDGHFTEQLTKNVNIGLVARRPGVVGHAAAYKFADSVGALLSGKNMTIHEFLKQIPSIAQTAGDGAFRQHVEGVDHLLRQLVEIGGMTGNLNHGEVVGATIDRYWPRIETDQFFETRQKGLYVVGDAAGVSRGYIQAMWSARCAAFAIIKKFNGCRVENKSRQHTWDSLNQRYGRIATVAA